MRGHNASVKAVAFFNDARHVVTSSRDTTLLIWDTQKGTSVGKPFEGHKGSVLSLTVSPDDRRIASGGDDTTIIIWDVESRQKIFDPLVKHAGGVHSVRFSPDGQRLASGSHDFTIVVWDAQTGAILVTLKGHRKGVFSVAFSPDGQNLVSGSADCTIRVWCTDNAELLFEIDAAHQDCVRSVAWSPDGQQLISASYDTTVKFWDASTGRQIGEPCTGHTAWIYTLAVSFDGSFIATGSRDKTVKLWSTKTRQQIEQPLEHVDRVLCLAISPNGALLASGGLDREVCLWSVKDMFKRYDIKESREEVLQLEQRLPFIDINKSQMRTGDHPHASLGSSSAHSLFDVTITSSEPNEGMVRAGDKDEKSAGDTLLLDCVEHTLASQTRDSNSTPQVSLMQVELDYRLPVHPEATLQDLTTSITKIGDYPVARGGFGEIWKCIYHTDRGPINVAVKSLMVYAADEGDTMAKKAKRILREFKMCARLQHPNILPVYGCTHGFGLLMAIVYPWAENGNLTTFLDHENAMLTVIKRFQILKDITVGLQYLHAKNVIHGDLNGANVLILGDGTACLADFGLSLIYSEVMSTSAASWTSTFHGNFRWLAPELLGQPDDDIPVRPSKHSDIYSFGGIMLQVLTSKIPYYYLGDAAVILCIGTGVKPSRSRYPAFCDEYWDFIEECWSAGTQDRPSADRVVEVIRDGLDSLSSSLELFCR